MGQIISPLYNSLRLDWPLMVGLAILTIKPLPQECCDVILLPYSLDIIILTPSSIFFQYSDFTDRHVLLSSKVYTVCAIFYWCFQSSRDWYSSKTWRLCTTAYMVYTSWSQVLAWTGCVQTRSFYAREQSGYAELHPHAIWNGTPKLYR